MQKRFREHEVVVTNKELPYFGKANGGNDHQGEEGQNYYGLIALFVLLIIGIGVIYFSVSSSQQSHQQLTERMQSIIGSTPPLPEQGTKDLMVPVGEKNNMHVLVGGADSKYVFLLIHGGSRKNQDAGHWTPHFDFFGNKGKYYAVDLLGHGESQPGRDSSSSPSLEEKGRGLEALLEGELKDAQSLIVVARSAGGPFALDVAKRYTSKVKGLILVAPALAPKTLSLPQAVLDIPALLIWSKEDPVISYDKRAEPLRDMFTRGRLVTFNKVTSNNDPSWMEHMPENIAVAEFHDKVTDWLSTLQ